MSSPINYFSCESGVYSFRILPALQKNNQNVVLKARFRLQEFKNPTQFKNCAGSRTSGKASQMFSFLISNMQTKHDFGVMAHHSPQDIIKIIMAEGAIRKKCTTSNALT